MSDGSSEREGKGRGGRPSLGKRGTFSFRVTDGLRQKLEAEAQEQKRPVSEIIEARLEQSFARSAVDTYSEQLAHIAGLAAASSLLRTGVPWSEGQAASRYTFTRIVFELARVMSLEPHTEKIEDEPKRKYEEQIQNLALKDSEQEAEARRNWWGQHGGLLNSLVGKEVGTSADRERPTKQLKSVEPPVRRSRSAKTQT